MALYDRQEAVSLISGWKEATSPTGARSNAAKLLLQEFAALWEEQELEVSPNSADGALFLQSKTENGVKVYADRRGEISIVSVRRNPLNWLDITESTPVKLPLILDPVRGKLTSSEIDENLTPKPGEPKPRRSAMAVLAEAVVGALNPAPAPSKT